MPSQPLQVSEARKQLSALVERVARGGPAVAIGRYGRLLATIEDRAVVEQILTHLGLPVEPPRPSPARTPAWLPGVRNGADHECDAGGHWAD